MYARTGDCVCMCILLSFTVDYAFLSTVFVLFSLLIFFPQFCRNIEFFYLGHGRTHVTSFPLSIVVADIFFTENCVSCFLRKNLVTNYWSFRKFDWLRVVGNICDTQIYIYIRNFICRNLKAQTPPFAFIDLNFLTIYNTNTSRVYLTS